ncbi:MAG TPA: hypothetical protein VMT47_00325 [Polyangia bacterium]|nr:hypothetical protein [Polyangia bacterium]
MSPEHTRRASRRKVVVAAFFALLVGGCSFQVVKPAPPPSTWPDPVRADSSEHPCTDSIGLPVVDTIIGGSLGTLTYIERDAGSRLITIGIGIATVPYLASAIYGYIQTARCRHYKSRFRPEP